MLLELNTEVFYSNFAKWYQPFQQEEEMKKCPYCAEEIQDDALVCRFCGRDLNKPMQLGNPQLLQAAKDASSALTMSIIGLFCFGIILEPIAIYKAGKAKNLLGPMDDGYGKAQAAQIIGWIGLVLYIIIIIYNLSAVGSSY